MRSNYKKLGRYIRQVDERNSDLVSETVLGINIDKYFMPSVANIVGTDLRNYKLLRHGRFACNAMHVGRDSRLPVALYTEDIPALVSPAYFMFEIVDENEITPEYLMLCFRQPDFDRMCWFKTDASVRGGITWDEICDLTIPVPPISEQRKIVHDYQVITDRIKLLRKINEELEDMAFASYLSLIEKDTKTSTLSTLGDVALITTGKLNSEDANKNGAYPFFTCSQETYRTDSYAFDQEAVLLAGNNASAVYPLKMYSGKFNAYQRTYVISSTNPNMSNKQIYFVLKQKLREFKEQSYGTATKFLTLTLLEPIPILIPSKQIHNRFSCIADHCFKLIANHNDEIDLLERIKKLYMANLIKETKSKR